MKWKRKLSGLAAGVLMILSLTLSAQASGYSDLPTSHWAYDAMNRAANLGLISGVGGDRMAPSDILTWAQYLTMLSRAFASGDFQSALEEGMSWDQAAYRTAMDKGIILPRESLPVDRDDLHVPISRQDVAVLLSRAMPEGAEDYYYSWGTLPEVQDVLSDFYQMDQLHREAVRRLYDGGVTRGKADGTFGMNDTIQRADGTFMLVKVVGLVDQLENGEEKTIHLRFQDKSGQTLLPEQQADSYVGQSLYGLAYQWREKLSGYVEAEDNFSTGAVSSACDTYTLIFRPQTKAERQDQEFWDKVSRGEAAAEDYWKQDFWLELQGDNYRKRELLFGNTDQCRFADRAEAEANMVKITVPIWKLSKGQKVASTATLSIHAALAQDVTELFTEIFNDPEQFPIHAVGGYSWRGDNATGEHNCGTAIDINANENYQVRDGKAMVGKLWKPGENPYSMPVDGSVVRIFAEHGWSWGGDAWSWGTDPDEGYHDYMHFSYLGG